LCKRAGKLVDSTMIRSVFQRRFIFVCLFCLALSVAQGAVIYLKTGERPRGKIVEKTDKGIRLQKIIHGQTGEIFIQWSEIESIDEDVRGHIEIFAERYAMVSEDDAQGFYELGTWCESVGLANEASSCFMRAIKIDSYHDQAAIKLDMERDSDTGKWITYAELMRKKGRLLYEGEWITFEEKEQILLAKQAEAQQLFEEGVKDWMDAWKSFSKQGRGAQRNRRSRGASKDPFREFEKKIDSAIEKFEQAQTTYPPFKDDNLGEVAVQNGVKIQVDLFLTRTLETLVTETKDTRTAAQFYIKGSNKIKAGDLKIGTGGRGGQGMGMRMLTGLVKDEDDNRIDAAVVDYKRAIKLFQEARMTARTRPNNEFKKIIKQLAETGIESAEDKIDEAKDLKELLDRAIKQQRYNGGNDQDTGGLF